MEIERQAEAKQRFRQDISRLLACKRTELIPTIREVVSQWQVERVDYHRNKKFNCTVRYEGELITLSANIQGEKCATLAALIYSTLQENGVVKPGEVHANSKFSTKHHRTGYEVLKNAYS